MNNTINWCKQNNRPTLASYMTVNRFQTLMLVVATAISGMNGGRDWGEQALFLKSEDGSKYLKQLTVLVKAHTQAPINPFLFRKSDVRRQNNESNPTCKSNRCGGQI
jgi:hypothetical protein